MKGKGILGALFVWGFFCMIVSSAFASDGKVLFQQKCGKCHKSGGEAASFAPTKYASLQWERFFERDKHARKKDISADFSSDELFAIKKYLVEHAADSDQPEAVGLR